MKIKLLNDGGYGELEHINFPIVVNGTSWLDCGFDVYPIEFRQFGLSVDEYDDVPFYFSFTCGECEVIE